MSEIAAYIGEIDSGDRRPQWRSIKKTFQVIGISIQWRSYFLYFCYK